MGNMGHSGYRPNRGWFAELIDPSPMSARCKVHRSPPHHEPKPIADVTPSHILRDQLLQVKVEMAVLRQRLEKLEGQK
jgi:hypothetical protein